MNILSKDSFQNLYNRLFRIGSERSTKAKKNIALLAIYKGISIAISLIMVPLTLNYVDSGTYGIWLTLSSIVGWISFFDIGLNNGLKNRLAESIAKGDVELGRTYVSTTYAMLTLIFIPLMVILLIIAPFLNWNSLLKLDAVSNDGLVIAVSIIIVYFCINFVLSTINVVIMAHQSPAEASLRTLIQQVFSLLVILILTITTKGSLVKLCIGLCVSPLIVVYFFNLTLFRGKYRALAPSFKYIEFKKVPDLLKLGVKFFIISIAAVVQFQLINLLIIRNYGADEVTTYNIAYKYFNVLYMIWGILMTPVWVAVTDAAAKNDYSWIKNMKNKYMSVFALFMLVGIVMLVSSGFVYKVWVGDKVSVPFVLSLWIFIYNAVLMFGSLYVSILNGLGELNVQTIACCLSPFVFLFIAEMLMKHGVGMYSLLIASVMANFNGFLLAPIQCHRLLMKRN